jgi:hypothetical protein
MEASTTKRVMACSPGRTVFPVIAQLQPDRYAAVGIGVVF